MTASRASNGFGEAGAYVAGGATGRRPGRHGSTRLVRTALPDGDRTYNARSGRQASPLGPCMSLVTLSEEGNICASDLAVHHSADAIGATVPPSTACWAGGPKLLCTSGGRRERPAPPYPDREPWTFGGNHGTDGQGQGAGNGTRTARQGQIRPGSGHAACRRHAPQPRRLGLPGTYRPWRPGQPGADRQAGCRPVGTRGGERHQPVAGAHRRVWVAGSRSARVAGSRSARVAGSRSARVAGSRPAAGRRRGPLDHLPARGRHHHPGVAARNSLVGTWLLLLPNTACSRAWRLAFGIAGKMTVY